MQVSTKPKHMYTTICWPYIENIWINTDKWISSIKYDYWLRFTDAPILYIFTYISHQNNQYCVCVTISYSIAIKEIAIVKIFNKYDLFRTFCDSYAHIYANRSYIAFTQSYSESQQKYEPIFYVCFNRVIHMWPIFVSIYGFERVIELMCKLWKSIRNPAVISLVRAANPFQ